MPVCPKNQIENWCWMSLPAEVHQVSHPIHVWTRAGGHFPTPPPPVSAPFLALSTSCSISRSPIWCTCLSRTAVAEDRKKKMCKNGFYMECFLNKLWNAEYAQSKNWSSPRLCPCVCPLVPLCPTETVPHVSYRRLLSRVRHVLGLGMCPPAFAAMRVPFHLRCAQRGAHSPLCPLPPPALPCQ